MYKLRVSKRFEKAFDLCARRGYDMNVIKKAMRLLEENGELPPEYKTHKLTGEYK